MLSPLHPNLEPKLIIQAGKLLLLIGIVIAAIGAITLLGAQFKWFRIGRLPGDLLFERNGMTILIPITSMLLISAILTGMIWLAERFRR